MITPSPGKCGNFRQPSEIRALYLASVIYRDFPVIALHEAVIRIMAA
jgi:hypothetical protein